jgi:hypothetical protein
MLKLVADNDRIPRSPEFAKGFSEGLRRVAGVTSGERSIDEWKALLMIFRWTTEAIENKVKLLQQRQKEQGPRIVE